MISSCSGERWCSKLKFIKDRLRTTMTQERPSDLALPSTAHGILRQINFDDVINDFANTKHHEFLGLLWTLRDSASVCALFSVILSVQNPKSIHMEQGASTHQNPALFCFLTVQPLQFIICFDNFSLFLRYFLFNTFQITFKQKHYQIVACRVFHRKWKFSCRKGCTPTVKSNNPQKQ